MKGFKGYAVSLGACSQLSLDMISIQGLTGSPGDPGKAGLPVSRNLQRVSFFR